MKCSANEFDQIFAEHGLDFDIYGCILYQLVSNSIKHSPNNTQIKLILDFMIEYLPNQDFSGTLSSILEDQGTGIDAQEKFEMFSFDKIVSY